MLADLAHRLGRLPANWPARAALASSSRAFKRRELLRHPSAGALGVLSSACCAPRISLSRGLDAARWRTATIRPSVVASTMATPAPPRARPPTSSPQPPITRWSAAAPAGRPKRRTRLAGVTTVARTASATRGAPTNWPSTPTPTGGGIPGSSPGVPVAAAAAARAVAVAAPPRTTARQSRPSQRNPRRETTMPRKGRGRDQSSSPSEYPRLPLPRQSPII